MTEHVRADADAIVIRGEDGIRASEVVVGAATDVGRLRTINEDGYLATAPAFMPAALTEVRGCEIDDIRLLFFLRDDLRQPDGKEHGDHDVKQGGSKVRFFP